MSMLSGGSVVTRTASNRYCLARHSCNWLLLLLLELLLFTIYHLLWLGRPDDDLLPNFTTARDWS